MNRDVEIDFDVNLGWWFEWEWVSMFGTTSSVVSDSPFPVSHEHMYMSNNISDPCSSSNLLQRVLRAHTM